MPYCTLAQLTDRIGERMLVALTDRAEVPTGAVDTAVVDRAIAEADALIDGYLAGKYALPLAAVPPVVNGVSLALTIWNLHITEPEAKVKADYDQAIKRLGEIAKGTIILTDVAGVEPAAPTGSGVQVTDRERAFTPDTMKGFV